MQSVAKCIYIQINVIHLTIHSCHVMPFVIFVFMKRFIKYVNMFRFTINIDIKPSYIAKRDLVQKV